MFKRNLFFSMTRHGRVRKFRDQGDAAMRKHEWAQAVSLYRPYLAYNQSDTAILVQFGHALKELEHLDEALQAYSNAVSSAPADTDARLHLTSLLNRMEHASVASKQEHQAEALNESAAVSANGKLDQRDAAPAIDNVLLGDRQRDKKKWREAARHYSAHLAAHPHQAEIWLQLGHMLKEALLFEDAVYAYRVAKRLEVEPSDVAIHLADLLQRLGRSIEARPLWADLYRQNKSFFLQNI